MAILKHINGNRYKFHGGKGAQAVVEISGDGREFRAVAPIAPPNQRAGSASCSTVEYLLGLGDDFDRERWAAQARRDGAGGSRITIVARGR